ncbi:50S ribosomal protein L30 [Serinibacter salmoneus]|uniref:Large ribosomal subunit protein uL30 n=1 Tax=Serinibacter salmoneus TaxID=556530 RepID=A0A2A9CWZ6_9MICO|nr:50S ribosomal protein L30 [Serinibacter salmoneus]PFG18948.1 large subunit ribosomal protein L30 [Serinibacter salmoneus]
MAQLQVTQTRSAIGGKHNQRETLRTLGLGKIGRSSIQEDNSQVRGMIRVVDHLVTVEEVD